MILYYTLISLSILLTALAFSRFIGLLPSEWGLDSTGILLIIILVWPVLVPLTVILLCTWYLFEVVDPSLWPMMLRKLRKFWEWLTRERKLRNTDDLDVG